MSSLTERVIVALDVPTLKEAERFVDMLSPRVKIFKVGGQLFTAYGPEVVQMVAKKKARVFLDLKFHDIPNTVGLSVASGTALACTISPFASSPNIENDIKEVMQAPVCMMTVHTKGGLEMLKAAARGAAERAGELRIKKPLILGVTRLTSDEEIKDTKTAVLEAGRLAKEAGLDGVICAVPEAALVRREFGKDFIIVTPGIRSGSDSTGDQKRTGTAGEAFAAGADYIVVGRPILKAADPLKALEDLTR